MSPRAMTRYVFEEVKVRAAKTAECPVCGKKRRLRKTFWQTLNPFNQNPDGSTKSRSDIQLALGHEARAWVLEPELCRTHQREAVR